MPTYKFTLGNITERPGHRHDCAHLRVEIEIPAADEQQALARLLRASDVLRITLPAGMGLGVAAYNDAMGYDLEPAFDEDERGRS